MFETKIRTQKLAHKKTIHREENLKLPEVVQKKEYSTALGLLTEVSFPGQARPPNSAAKHKIHVIGRSQCVYTRVSLA